MRTKKINIVFFMVCSLFWSSSKSFAQIDTSEAHVKVAMRMIGHQVLLHSGDSTSRVLAVEKVENRYKIEFEAKFQFTPDVLVKMIDEIVLKTKVAEKYLVEVEDCENATVVYSFEILNSVAEDLTPCGSRTQPTKCYKLWFTIRNTSEGKVLPIFSKTKLFASPKEWHYSMIILPILSLLILVSTFVYFRKEKIKQKPTTTPPSTPETTPINSNIIQIGKYQFDTKNMLLSLESEPSELTPKEAELLLLLHNSANIVLERDYILKMVWGDEGDYIGRTLDVFISKLRKKLAADTALKIVNIRGVGYKFVVNEA
jgi:DNA-binding winged helix-turn-helix (wHTH) protein